MPVSEIQLTGGLNSDDSIIEIKPGQCLQLHNYEVNTLGRYARMEGFERFDGQKRPSDEGYYAVEVASTAGIAVDDALTVNSDFTVVVVGVDADANLIGVVDIPDDKRIEDGMTIGATTTLSQQLIRGHTNYDTDRVWQLYAEARLRNSINMVPGGGPIRGIQMFNGVTYAFRDDAEVDPTCCKVWKSTDAGWVEFHEVNDAAGAPDTIAPGGHYEFRQNTFPEVSSELLMLCTNGVDKAMYFDGYQFRKIDDFFDDIYPSHLEVLPSKILVLGYSNGSLMYSEINDCRNFDPADGGAEISIGEGITGILVQPSETHVIFQRDAIHAIYGTNPSDFRRTVLANTAGAYEYTIQDVLEPMFVNDKGLSLLSRVQQFGDFQQASVTQRVERLMDAQRKLVSCAVMIREKNQYRLFYKDGSGLIGTFDNGQVVGFSTFDLGGRVARCAYSCKEPSGIERVFFGSDDGYVYEMERGNSQDGAEFTSVCRPAFNFVQGPEQRKRFKKFMVEVRTQGLSNVRLMPELDYDGSESPRHTHEDSTFIGPGGYWGEGIWGEFVWSAPTVLQVEFYLRAVSRNLSPTIFSTSDFESPHTLNSALLEYEMRGKRR